MLFLLKSMLGEFFALVSAEFQGNQFRGIYTIILLIRADGSS